MIVECPKCSKDKEIEYAKNIVCDECNSSFFGYRFKKHRKKLVSATAALMIGTAGGYKINDYLVPSDNRYPLEIEYQLVERCLNAETRILTRKSHAMKQEICLCAVGRTASGLNYSDLKDQTATSFTRIFQNNIANCR